MPMLRAEEQMLIAALALSERSGRLPTDPQPMQDVHAFGVFYFGRYCADWMVTPGVLKSQDLAAEQEGIFSLTASGAARAVELRAAHPRHVYAYNEFFYRARRSPAHARFCERVYGRDLCQHGMADMRQVDDLVSRLKTDRAQSILELGCGNGAMTAYIAERAGATAVGVDIAAEGIAWALECAAQRPGSLTFITADMTTVELAPASFDAVILIDAVYFVPDVPAFIQHMLTWLRPAGRIYVFNSAWVDAPDQRDLLEANSTKFAQALNDLAITYQVINISATEAAHWQRKRQVAEEMKAEFESEGNTWLYQRRWGEAESHRQYVEQGLVSRYLYVIGKPT